jgi:NAD(P)H-flavin reductase
MFDEKNIWIPSMAKIVERRLEMNDCVTISCVIDNQNLFFYPGQFYMIYVFGHGEVPISVSGDPDDTSKLTFTVMSVGMTTRALCNLKIGDSIGLRGPFGRGWPINDCKGKNIIIVAGGLGLAPLRPVIYHALKHRDDFSNLILLYGARTNDLMIFYEEVRKWQAESNRIQVLLTVDYADRCWDGHVGLVTDLWNNAFDNDDPLHSDAIALVCGPEIMMRYTSQVMLQTGLKNDCIYISMERNMKCAIGICGRCQYGSYFTCREGPVFKLPDVERLLSIREV